MLFLNNLTRLFNWTFLPEKSSVRPTTLSELSWMQTTGATSRWPPLKSSIMKTTVPDFWAAIKSYEELAQAVPLMIQSLERMAPGVYPQLSSLFTRIDSAIRAEGLRVDPVDPSSPLVLPLDSLPSPADKLVGGKAANLSRIKWRRGFLCRKALLLPPGPTFLSMRLMISCRRSLPCLRTWTLIHPPLWKMLREP